MGKEKEEEEEEEETLNKWIRMYNLVVILVIWYLQCIGFSTSMATLLGFNISLPR